MSERIDARQTTPASAAKHANGVQETLGKRARERNSPLPSADTAGSTLPRPAHPSNRLLAQLNERWRVVDDPLQWRLQKKKGNLRDKNSGWDNRSFCRTKDDLRALLLAGSRPAKEHSGVQRRRQSCAAAGARPPRLAPRLGSPKRSHKLGRSWNGPSTQRTPSLAFGVQGICGLRCWRIAIRKSSLCSLLV
jgi:hypothetical protein